MHRKFQFALLLLLTLVSDLLMAADYWVLTSFFTKEAAEAEVARLRAKDGIDARISKHRQLYRVVVANEDLPDEEVWSMYVSSAWRISEVNLMHKRGHKEKLGSEEKVASGGPGKQPGEVANDKAKPRKSVTAITEAVAPGMATNVQTTAATIEAGIGKEETRQTRAPDRLSRSTAVSRKTEPGETLWEIAAETRPERNIPIPQMMLALKRANPDAFINDNINLLKANAVLRIPKSQQIREERLQSAVAQVREDNEAFAALRDDSSRSDKEAPEPRDEQAAPDELRLLVPEQITGATAASKQGEIGRLANRLAITEEQLESQSRSIPQLNSRISNLEGQLETLVKIVKARDDQINVLVTELNRLSAESAQIGAAVISADEDAKPVVLLDQSGKFNDISSAALLVLSVLFAIAALSHFRARFNTHRDQETTLEQTLSVIGPDDLPPNGAAPKASEIEDQSFRWR